MQQLIESAVEFIVPLAIALALILFGRRVFWVLGALAFAAAAVVLVGVTLLPNALDIQTAELSINIELSEGAPATPFIIAGAIGAIVGIIFTVRFPKAASAIVGFCIGLFFLTLTFELFAFGMPEPVRRSLLIIGGTILAVIAIRQPAETMIILSTLLGSEILVESLNLDLNSPLSAFVWLFTMLIGIIYQTSVWRVEQRKQSERQAATIARVAAAS